MAAASRQKCARRAMCRLLPTEAASDTMATAPELSTQSTVGPACGSPNSESKPLAHTVSAVAAAAAKVSASVELSEVEGCRLLRVPCRSASPLPTALCAGRRGSLQHLGNRPGLSSLREQQPGRRSRTNRILQASCPRASRTVRVLRLRALQLGCVPIASAAFGTSSPTVLVSAWP